MKLAFKDVCAVIKQRDDRYADGYRQALLDLSHELKYVDPIIIVCIAPVIKNVQKKYRSIVDGTWIAEKIPTK